jgi:hypothetical protein
MLGCLLRNPLFFSGLGLDKLGGIRQARPQIWQPSPKLFAPSAPPWGTYSFNRV